MPDLQEDIRWIRFGGIPDPLLDAAILAKVGRKTFDVPFLANALKETFVDKKLEKLRDTDPGLAQYYDSALADFSAQLTSRKDPSFWRGRLAQLEQGLAFVQAAPAI